MIIKEKIIFFVLVPALVATMALGINAQGKKRQSSHEFLKDIESVTEKAKAKKKTAKDNWDIEGLKKQEALEDYQVLTERSIFFRPASEARVKNKEDVVPLKEEEPKKKKIVYKGRMMLGNKVIVIIEDQNTGKSFSVKEGDTTDGFTVLSIGEKEIMLKKKDGEEISVSTVKEEKKDVGDGRDRPLQTEEPKGIDEKK